MKFSTPLVILSILVVGSSSAIIGSMGYDETYDSYYRELSTVACSDGSNGLVTKGFTNFGSLPTFPYIGGISAISGWNSTNCGTCWKLTLNDTTINMLALDVVEMMTEEDKMSGVTSFEALNHLTNGKAYDVGIAGKVVYENVHPAVCGL